MVNYNNKNNYYFIHTNMSHVTANNKEAKLG